jgi:signal transduction histidine kinase
VILIIVSTAMALLAITRLVRGSSTSPYVLAQLDQLLAGILIAVGTGSLVITIASVLVIALAIAATFRAKTRVAIVVSLVTCSPAAALAIVLDASSPSDDAPYVAALVLIAIALALAAFVLGFFAIQTRSLRQQLTNHERQLEAILEVTPVVLAAIDPSRNVVTLAGDAEEWRQLSGQPIPPESTLATLVAASGNGNRTTGDITLGERIFNVTCDPGSNGEVLITAHDVTVRLLAKQRLEELLASKDQFIAAVSHELRTPLASVLGFSELIQEQMDPAHPLAPMVTEVADESAEMAAIIDDLLIAARTSLESVSTEARDVNLAAEASAVIDTMRSRLSKRPTARLDHAVAHADPIRVRQIIRNLLTNADRYGGTSVEVATRISGSSALLVVRDSGPPLPEDRREAIFEPYESSGPVRGQPAAIGLGLSVSRALAELMGGSISYSHDGTWSAFELRLPVGLARTPSI